MFINACIFVCGLVVGGAFAYLIYGNETKNTEETVADCGDKYPQVYGLDLSFWQGNIHWDQLSLPCDEDGSVCGKIPAPCKQRPVQFAFIRVTKSDSLADSLYHLQVSSNQWPKPMNKGGHTHCNISKNRHNNDYL